LQCVPQAFFRGFVAAVFFAEGFAANGREASLAGTAEWQRIRGLLRAAKIHIERDG